MGGAETPENLKDTLLGALQQVSHSKSSNGQQHSGLAGNPNNDLSSSGSGTFRSPLQLEQNHLQQDAVVGRLDLEEPKTGDLLGGQSFA